MNENYRGAKLDGADLSGRDLTGADLRGASLAGADLRGARLEGARLRGANVAGADFSGAALADADLCLVRGADTARWPDGLDVAARTAPPPPPAPQTEAERLLGLYFDVAGRLKEIPIGQTRQRIVLTRIVDAFAAGTNYPEKEVNAILQRFHPDFATLRRYLIDHRFMAREKNVYWRL